MDSEKRERLLELSEGELQLGQTAATRDVHAEQLILKMKTTSIQKLKNGAIN